MPVWQTLDLSAAVMATFDSSVFGQYGDGVIYVRDGYPDFWFTDIDADEFTYYTVEVTYDPGSSHDAGGRSLSITAITPTLTQDAYYAGDYLFSNLYSGGAEVGSDVVTVHLGPAFAGWDAADFGVRSGKTRLLFETDIAGAVSQIRITPTLALAVGETLAVDVPALLLEGGTATTVPYTATTLYYDDADFDEAELGASTTADIGDSSKANYVFIDKYGYGPNNFNFAPPVDGVSIDSVQYVMTADAEDAELNASPQDTALTPTPNYSPFIWLEGASAKPCMSYPDLPIFSFGTFEMDAPGSLDPAVNLAALVSLDDPLQTLYTATDDALARLIRVNVTYLAIRITLTGIEITTPGGSANIPPLRQYPRSDGLGVGTKRLYPPPPSIQRGIRRAGGYL